MKQYYCKVNETPGKEEKVNKEQPPVLSDEEISECLKERYKASHPDNKIIRAREWLRRHDKEVHFIKEAQRDADVAYYEPLIQQIIEEWQDKLVQRDVGWLKQKAIEIQQAKAEEREKVLDEIFEEIDTQVNKLTEHSNELNTQRQPIIEAMNTRNWTPEEDEFMYSSVIEIVEIPNRIALLNNLKQFIKSEYLKED